MKNEWKLNRLSEFIIFGNGKTKPKGGALFPIYGGNGILGYCDEFNSEDVVIIGRVGAYCGNVFLENSKCWVSDNAIHAKSKGSSDINFIYYLLKNLKLNLRKIGSSQPLLTQGILNSIEVKLPSLHEQKVIAKILSSLDKKINLNNQINQNLEAQAQAIFKSWFVNFEPFKNGKFIDSELGKIPEGWRVKRLGDICCCELGGTPSRSKPEYWNGKIPWINSGKVNEFRIISESEFISDLGLKKSATKLLPRKTTVFAITGATLGQVSLLEIESCANQSVIGVIENASMPYEYIYPFALFNIKELISHQTGGAQQHINKDNIESLKIIVPTADILNSYKKQVASLYSQITNNVFESQRLAQLRDTLLPKLMSGEIGVSNLAPI